jgi:IS5 family transposase
MLQKWFRINSDPELESQINDRLSFKRFLQLPLDKPLPDHSIFSRFRSRLSKEAMDQLNSEFDASLKRKAWQLMKALLSMLGSLNPPAIPSPTIKLKNL